MLNYNKRKLLIAIKIILNKMNNWIRIILAIWKLMKILSAKEKIKLKMINIKNQINQKIRIHLQNKKNSNIEIKVLY